MTFIELEPTAARLLLATERAKLQTRSFGQSVRSSHWTKIIRKVELHYVDTTVWEHVHVYDKLPRMDFEKRTPTKE
jgi:hypothetical protein